VVPRLTLAFALLLCALVPGVAAERILLFISDVVVEVVLQFEDLACWQWLIFSISCR
jgi:hypothetical protein